MSISRIYLDGEAFSFIGNTQEEPDSVNRTSEPTRDGDLSDLIEPKLRTISVDDFSFSKNGDEQRLIDFIEAQNCNSAGFSMKITIGEGCSDGVTEYTYTGCKIQGGSTVFTHHTKKISGFAAAYKSRSVNIV